jgi:hypothetical protein
MRTTSRSTALTGIMAALGGLLASPPALPAQTTYGVS